MATKNSSFVAILREDELIRESVKTAVYPVVEFILSSLGIKFDSILSHSIEEAPKNGLTVGPHLGVIVDYYYCGETDERYESFPLAWLDLPNDALKAEIERLLERQAEAEANRRSHDAAARAEHVRTQELAQLARLKAKYPDSATESA